MSTVELRNLSYRFPGGEHDVLRNVSWSALEGSVNLLVGPSGSGKTTMLHCMNGIIPHFHGGAYGGDTHLFGKSTMFTAPRDLAGTVGTVFQDPESQFITDSVEDEIVFGMENLGYERRTMRMRLEETLDLLGIQHLRLRSITELSGGERQRVALAAALVTRPQVILLDEPTSQLDPLAAHDILSAVERLNLDFGMTVVVAEHRLDRILPFAGQLIAVDHAGIEHGPVQQMLRTLEDVPPLVAFGRHHGWDPLPLTVRDARRNLHSTLAPHEPASTTSTPGEHVLAVQGVSYRYGGRQAIKDVSFDGASGEVVALVGKNGSGKSTLLRQIIGLLRPERGQILVHIHNIARSPVQDIARSVGYVPQFPTAILHQETLLDEITFTLRAKNVVAEPGDIAHLLGIGHLMDRHPLDLSGGQRQRAALAAIAVTRPEILLLDEPTRGLDGLEKRRLAEFVREYASEGRLVIVATHDVEFLAQCATRVLLMADGEMIADGRPADVLSGSLTFSTQMNRLFGGDILTLADAGVTSELS